MIKFARVSLAVALSFCMGSEAFAIGGAFIGDETPSARAAGEGYVGVAGQNNDPTAVFTNPAAMTALSGTQATAGVSWENIHGGFKDSSGNQTKERVTDAGVPNVSVTQSFMDGKLAAGLSVQSPFGLETYWPGNSPMSFVATDTRLDLADIMPAIAYQVSKVFSIGVGADFVDVFNATLNRAVYVSGVNSNLGFPSASPNGSSSVSGQGTAWGYHGGVTIQPNEQNAFGIAYHSKEVIQILGSLQLTGMSGAMAQVFGGSNYSTSVYTDLVLPQNIQFGYAYKPTDKWILEADAAWYDWSQDKDLNFRYAGTNATQQAILTNSGQGNPTPLSPRDAWSFNTGANYKVNDKWQLRGGFFYEPWAVPEANYSPAYMDLSRYGLSTGFGYSVTENLGIDAAYTAIFMHNRTINNSVQQNDTGIPDGALGTGINGTYSDFANVVSLNLTYRFGSQK